MEYVEDFEYKGHRIKIAQDIDPTAPDEGDGYPVYMVHFHSHFHTCPDDLPFRNERELEEWFEPLDREDYDGYSDEEYAEEVADWQKERDEWIVFPVSAYIHSGIALSLGNGSGWDTSNCGFVFIKRDDWGSSMDDEGYSFTRDGKTTVTTWRKLAKQHVNTWNQYLQGEVYGYMIEGPEELQQDRCPHCKEVLSESVEREELESVWGFFGLEYCIEEAKRVADGYVEEVQP